MDVKQLKAIADNHGIEYQKNYGAKKMAEILEQNGIHIKVDENPVTPDFQEPVMAQPVNPMGNTSNLEYEFQTAINAFRSAQNELDLRRAAQLREVAKKKIKDSNNIELYKRVLAWERTHKVIDVASEYELNALEMDELDSQCECIRKLPSSGMHVHLGDKIKYRKYFDESKQTDIYTFYPIRTIEPEEQISKELSNKMARGFMPEKGDYSPAKDVVHRFSLRASEFMKYFKTFEDAITF